MIIVIQPEFRAELAKNILSKGSFCCWCEWGTSVPAVPHIDGEKGREDFELFAFVRCPRVELAYRYKAGSRNAKKRMAREEEGELKEIIQDWTKYHKSRTDWLLESIEKFHIYHHYSLRRSWLWDPSNGGYEENLYIQVMYKKGGST
jgi:hypothetical protein